MKKIIIISAVVLAAAAGGWYFFLREPHFSATDGYLVNVNEKGVIMEGYDPVAYFTEQRPVKGSGEFTSKYEAATYWFASAEHKALFDKDPNK